MPEQSWIAGKTADAIAISIERGIHRGRANAGALLPTVRDLAETLGVSPATVAAAYKTLRQRGLVSGDGRRGTRVAPSHLRTFAPSHLRTLAPSSLIDLASAEPDPAMLPPLDRALDAVARTSDRGVDAAGLRSLTTFAAAEFEADSVAARFITIVAGGLDGVERVLREHLRPGDRVAAADPGCPILADLLTASGYSVHRFRVDDDGPIVEDVASALRARCRACIFVPRAHDPTGAAVTPERASELQRVLRTSPDALIVEYDPSGPIAGVPFVTVTTRARHWAVVRSTSHSLGDDLGLAVVAGDDTTITRVRARYALGPRGVSGLLQQLVFGLWSDPASGRRLARAADIYAQRRQALVDALAALSIAAHGRSGFNVWVPVREEAMVTAGLAQHGWAVAPGERFRERTPPGIRVTTATLAPPDAQRFAAALAEVMHPTAARR